MQTIESLGALIIYDDINKQISRRPNCSKVCADIKYKSPNWTLPTWIFRRIPSQYPITSIELYNCSDTLVFELSLSTLQQMSISIDGVAWDYFAYTFQHILRDNNIIQIIDSSDTCALYFKINTTGPSYYSELFCVYDRPGLTTENELVNGDFSNGLQGWVISNPNVILGGGQLSMNDITQAGQMFILNIPFNVIPGTVYKVCFTLTAYNGIGVNNRFRFETGTGRYEVNESGTHCFYTTNPGSLLASSLNSTWSIDNITVSPVEGTECMNMIRYKHSCNLDQIPYNLMNYMNATYIDAAFNGPEFVNLVESFENGKRDQFDPFYRVNIRHRFVAPEVPTPQVQALYEMAAHDTVFINIPEINETLDVSRNYYRTELTHTYDQDQKCYATVTLTATQKTLIKSGCCVPMEEQVCIDCEGELTELSLETVNCDGGFVRFFTTVAYPDLNVGMSVTLSGFTGVSTYLNGTHEITAVSVSETVFTMDLPCGATPSLNLGATASYTVFPIECYNTVDLFDTQNPDMIGITGTSVGPFVELLTATSSDENPDCDNLVFASTGLILSQEDFESTGFQFPVNPLAVKQCFKVRSFNPMIPDCEYNLSFCICFPESEG